MTDKVILEEIRVANHSVADAQSELAGLLNDIEIAPRAEKTKIGDALHHAVQKLRDAREHLAKLEKLIRGEDD